MSSNSKSENGGRVNSYELEEVSDMSPRTKFRQDLELDDLFSFWNYYPELDTEDRDSKKSRNPEKGSE